MAESMGCEGAGTNVFVDLGSFPEGADVGRGWVSSEGAMGMATGLLHDGFPKDTHSGPRDRTSVGGTTGDYGGAAVRNYWDETGQNISAWNGFGHSANCGRAGAQLPSRFQSSRETWRDLVRNGGKVEVNGFGISERVG